MSDVTLQKVYDEAKAFVQDTENGLEGLIVAIREHRTAERDEANPTQPDSEEKQPSATTETSESESTEASSAEAPADPPVAA